MTSGEKKRTARNLLELDPGSMMLTIYTLAAAMLVLFGWFGNADAVPVEESTVNQAVHQDILTPNEVQQGELLLPGPEPGSYRPAPLLSMDVDITYEIEGSGMIVTDKGSLTYLTPNYIR